jgi:hypothetical protein
MIERTPIAPEMPETEDQERPKRPPGRPRGTNYRRIDAHLHKMMRLAIAGGRAPSITEAARQFVGLAYGGGTDDAKVQRLVRTYPY